MDGAPKETPAIPFCLSYHWPIPCASHWPQHREARVQGSLGNIVPEIQNGAIIGSGPAGRGHREVHLTQILVLISLHANDNQHFYARFNRDGKLMNPPVPAYLLPASTLEEESQKASSRNEAKICYTNNLFQLVDI